MNLEQILKDAVSALGSQRDYEYLNGLCSEFDDLSEIASTISVMKNTGMLDTEKKRKAMRNLYNWALTAGEIYLRDDQ